MKKFDLEAKKLEYQERKKIKISVIEEESKKIKKFIIIKILVRKKLKIITIIYFQIWIMII